MFREAAHADMNSLSRFACAALAGLLALAASASLAMRGVGTESAWRWVLPALAAAALCAGVLRTRRAPLRPGTFLSRFAVIVAALLALRAFLPHGPALDWRFDDADGRRASQQVCTAWNAAGGAIELHANPPGGGSWSDRLYAHLPQPWLESGLRIRLRVTQPDWVVLDERGAPRASDGCTLVLRARRGEEWRRLEALPLAPATAEAQRTWLVLDADLDAADDAIAVEVHPGGPDSDNAFDRVWVEPRSVERTFAARGRAPWLALCDALTAGTLAALLAAAGGRVRRRRHEVAPAASIPTSRAWANHACDLAVVAFALWSVCCHAVVVAGGSLRTLLIVFAVAAALLLAGWVWWRRCIRSESRAKCQDLAGEGDEPVNEPRLWGLALLAALAAAISFAGSGLSLWLLLVGALGAGLVVALRDAPRPAPLATDTHDGRREGALLAVAALCAAIALCAHRSDLDDSYYIGAAAATADAPDAALLRDDVLHGVAGLPLHMPAARAQTLEMLNAAVALLTGIAPIRAFHWVTAAVAAFLLPLALARLSRLLSPRNWLWIVIATLGVLACAGDTHRSFGNFGLVRIWQGKSIYLTTVLPLIYAYAIRFGLAPTWGRAALLAAAQIAAVGCTTSALTHAPLAALAGALCAVRFDRRGVLTVLGTVLTSLYVLAVGFWLRPQLLGIAAEVPPLSSIGVAFKSALDTVLGFGPMRFVALLAIAGSWCVARGPARRWAVLVPLVALLGPLNPLLDAGVARYLTGPAFWRVMWSVPVPLLVALLLTSPLVLLRDRRLARVATAAAIAALAVLAPQVRALSMANGVRWAAPGLKVPPLECAWAARVVAAAPRGAVLAPEEISAWVPTLGDRSYPLMVRPPYLRQLRAEQGDAEADRRLWLTALVGAGEVSLAGIAPPAGGESWPAQIRAELRAALNEYALAAVCVSARAAHREALEAELDAAGFARVAADRHYALWRRSP